MGITEERLKFIVELAAKDWDSLRPGDWLNFRGDVETFFQGKGEYLLEGYRIIATPSERAADYPVEGFKELQSGIREVLSAITQPYKNNDDGSRARVGELPEFPINLKMGVLGGVDIVTNRGPLRDCFLSLALNTLAQVKAGQIRRCPAPDCNNFFYRHRKQLYCSATCNSRAYMQQYRSDPDVRSSENEQAHKRYAKKQKGKVARRPRKPRQAKKK